MSNSCDGVSLTGVKETEKDFSVTVAHRMYTHSFTNPSPRGLTLWLWLRPLCLPSYSVIVTMCAHLSSRRSLFLCSSLHSTADILPYQSDMGACDSQKEEQRVHVCRKASSPSAQGQKLLGCSTAIPKAETWSFIENRVLSFCFN